MSFITIAHISDIHYTSKPDGGIMELFAKHGIDEKKNLDLCLADLAERNPDILILTGDLTHEGDRNDYRFLKDKITAALPQTPVLCCMGNHDNRAAFREGFLGEAPDDSPYHAVLSVKGYRFLVLDTAYVKGNEGIIRDDCMDWLEGAMQKPAARGNLLLMHHPSMREAGSMGLTMSERFADILKSGRISALFNGHVHGSYTSTVYGVPQFTADSLKTGCDLHEDTLTYNNRAGYQILKIDDKNDWILEHVILTPEITTLLEKPF